MIDQEFAEWCGFEFIKDKRGWGRNTWVDPLTGNTLLKLPPIDYNFLFQYAEPKIYEVIEGSGGSVEEIDFSRVGDEYQCLIVWWTGVPKTDGYGVGAYSGQGDTYAEAMRKAIAEVQNNG